MYSNKKQSKQHFSFWSLLLCSLMLVSCQDNGQQPLEAFNISLYQPQYANGFEILGAKGSESSIIKVYNPWQGAKDVVKNYFIQRNNEVVPKGFEGSVLPADPKKIVCISTTYISILDEIGMIDRIVGVSGLRFVSNSYIKAHQEEIREVGREMNYEVLAGLQPDLVLIYGLTDEQTAMTNKLKELGIPYMYMGEYLEANPLGKAEWMMTLAEICNVREKGEKVFEAIPKRYNALKASVADLSHKPTVMVNVPWQDSWSMPSTESYVACLLRDAGADYIYKENTGNASKNIGLETAYKFTLVADYWVTVGMARSLEELKTMNPRFAEAKAVKDKRVYNNTKRTSEAGGNDYWESGVVRPDRVLQDLIYIFHPEVNPNDSLYYFEQLQ